MRKISIIFLIIILTNSTNAQWFWQNPWPQGNALHSISIPSENLIYAVSENNIVIKSTDSGESWKLNIIDTINTSGFYKIQFINAETGFLLSNKFYKTTNGAQNWVEINLGNASNKNFYFLDQVNGWITGSNGFFKTTDGGETWDSIPNYLLPSFDFINTTYGYCAGGYAIRKTTDGGYTWSDVYNGVQNGFYDIKILNDSIIIAVGSNGNIIRTENSGETWDTIFCPTNENLLDIESISQTTAWIVANGGVILKTTNSGVTWFPQTAYTSSGLYSIKFDGNQNGYIVGLSGKIFKTTDLGANWTRISKGYYENLKALFFISQDIGWAGGENGMLLKTSNGGDDWVLLNSPSTSIINDIYFSNENKGWISVSGAIYKTSNGGQDWIINSVNSGSFTFIDSLIGWIINGYKLYKTSDGGDNWTDINSDLTGYEQVLFISAQRGWALDFSGRIKTTTNGGISWFAENNFYPSDFRSMSFINENKGWIVGVDGKILSTIDGGINWYNQNSGVSNILSSVEFADEYNGYVLAYPKNEEKATLILTTNDGGFTWIKQPLKAVSRVNLLASHFIDNNIGWIIGDNGTILHTTNGGATFIDDENIIIRPKTFLLEQNYPNPFNPSTKIKYQIPKQSLVTLKILNVLGQEVEYLVNEEKTMGTYEIEFDAQSLPSGVYFYRLQAGNFVETKKMILLK